MPISALWLYGLVMLLIWAGYLAIRHSKQRKYSAIYQEALDAGLTEPPSLHPKIDPVLCQGCGACVTACPEQPLHTVLGLMHGKAALVDPTSCIGHGACATACPYDAITLVFGSETRGVDIPVVSPDFETNMDDIYIAGELGGMGLIRNAINQGQQAISSIARNIKPGRATDCYDVVIVGAGPAGLSASLQAINSGLNYITLEQDSLGGTVFQYPRGKLVMTAPFTLPVIGKVNFRETSKEKLLQFWTDVEQKTGIKVHYGEKVNNIVQTQDGYSVETEQSTYSTKSVLLAIGRRGTPRKLGVEGEELSKVVYRLIDPEQYKGMHVLVVGGGDSALEAATSIADQPDTTVTLSYRSEAFSRAKKKNRDKVELAEKSGKINVLMSSNVKSFSDKDVAIEHNGELVRIRNDAAIICAGGILPTSFLKEIGIHIETRYGTA